MPVHGAALQLAIREMHAVFNCSIKLHNCPWLYSLSEFNRNLYGENKVNKAKDSYVI